jgi:hypothetical protein
MSILETRFIIYIIYLNVFLKNNLLFLRVFALKFQTIYLYIEKKKVEIGE